LKPELFLYALRRAKALGISDVGAYSDGVDGRSGGRCRDQFDRASRLCLQCGGEGRGGDRGGFRCEAASIVPRRTGGSTQVFDRDTAMSAYRRFAAKGVSVTPTLNGSRILAYLDRDDHSKDEGLAYIGPKLRKTYDWRIERAAKADAAADRGAAQADRGCRDDPADAGRSGRADHGGGPTRVFSTASTIRASGCTTRSSLFVEKGLTPAQALASATRAGPAWFGSLDRYGAIRPGMAADLVLLIKKPARGCGRDARDRCGGDARQGPRPRGARQDARRHACAGCGMECRCGPIISRRKR
jgi:hypothetical protein